MPSHIPHKLVIDMVIRLVHFLVEGLLHQPLLIQIKESVFTSDLTPFFNVLDRHSTETKIIFQLKFRYALAVLELWSSLIVFNGHFFFFHFSQVLIQTQYRLRGTFYHGFC